MHRPLAILIRNLHSAVRYECFSILMKIQYMNLCVCTVQHFYIFSGCACVNQRSCSLVPLPVRAGNQALNLCHAGRSQGADEWLRPDTDACRGWSCHHYELFRVTVTPSSTLEEMPRLRDLQSAAWLGLSPDFCSATTARVQTSQLPPPGVINVVLILQTPASPFYLNLFKVASCLWPAKFDILVRISQPASQVVPDRGRWGMSGFLCRAKGRKKVEIFSNMKKLTSFP